MSVLDELRKKVLADDAGSYEAMDLCKRMLDWIDDFEAAHPGLVDRTVPCPRCGKPAVLNGDHTDRRLGYWRGVCPACEEPAP